MLSETAMPEILHLTLKQEYFVQIANKQKHTKTILFRNGYAKDAPEMLVGISGSAPVQKRSNRILRHPSWTHIENQTVAEAGSAILPHA